MILCGGGPGAGGFWLRGLYTEASRQKEQQLRERCILSEGGEGIVTEGACRCSVTGISGGD